MIDAVTQLLVREGLAMKPEDINIWYIHCGHWVTMHCTIHGRPSVLVKVAVCADGALDREANALQEMRSVIPRHLPQLMAFENGEALDILVQQYLDIQPLVLESGGLPQRHRWTTVIGAMARQTLPESGTNARRDDIFAGISQAFPSLEALTNRDTETPNLATLPSIEQHGDFTANNLGFRHGDTPVVYDWEDYGLVDVPGFDVALLLASFAEFDAIRLEDLFLNAKSLHHDDALELVLASGVEWDTFSYLLPAYYAIFYWLKGRGAYNPKLQSQCRVLIEALLQARP